MSLHACVIPRGVVLLVGCFGGVASGIGPQAQQPACGVALPWHFLSVLYLVTPAWLEQGCNLPCNCGVRRGARQTHAVLVHGHRRSPHVRVFKATLDAGASTLALAPPPLTAGGSAGGRRPRRS